MSENIEQVVEFLAKRKEESDAITHALCMAMPWYAVDSDGDACLYDCEPWTCEDGFDPGRSSEMTLCIGRADTTDWANSLRRYDAGTRMWVKP